MAPQQHKSATSIAPTTPPPSQPAGAVAQLPTSNSLQASTACAPATPVSPPNIKKITKRRRIARITRPEPGSIYDIMHDNDGESLFLTPICWTDAHARLLDVNFVGRDPVRKPVPDFNSRSSRYPPRPSRIATELSKDLTSILCPKSNHFDSAPIKQVMSTFFPSTLSKPKSDVDLEVHFASRRLKKAVRVAVLWQHPDSSTASFDSAATKPASSYGRIPSGDSQMSNWSCINSQSQSDRPILAYINRSHLAMVRRNLYRVLPGPLDGDRQNTPVLNLQQKRSKRLIPEDGDRDSYLVAVMLAIAQSQYYPPRTSSGFMSRKCSQGSSKGQEAGAPLPEFKDVPIRILSQDCDTADFVVYSTVVTAAFLKRFADPTKAPSNSAPHKGGLKVEITRVPVWPVLGLKERLAKALGPEIASQDFSQIFNEDIETWESEEERRLRVGSLKRSRDVLSEVFNTSFDCNDGSSEGRRPSFSIPSSPNIGGGLGITVASPPVSPRTPKRRRTQAISELEVC